MQNQFESIDAIEKHYGKLIKAEEDENQRSRIEIERDRAVVAFERGEAAQAKLEAHKATVLAKENLTEWSDLVSGSSPEQIDASVAKVKERLAAMNTAPVPVANGARSAYGNGAGPGGGTPPPPRRSETEEWLADFERKFNDGEQMSQRDFTRYTQTKLGLHGAVALKQNSRSQNMRDIDLSGIITT